MIYCEKKDLNAYCGISENLDQVIHLLSASKTPYFTPGSNPINGEAVFVNRMEYETVPEEEGFYEAHLRYLDVHVLEEGFEQICVSPVSKMEETRRDLEDDFVGYEGEAEVRFSMDPKKVLIVFPGEAHKVKVRDGKKSRVQKLVFKVESKERTM